MQARVSDSRAPGFWPLAMVFALFVLFLYGPMLTIVVLSFQGPEGGLTFPLRGVSLHWFAQLARGLGWVDAQLVGNVAHGITAQNVLELIR